MPTNELVVPYDILEVEVLAEGAHCIVSMNPCCSSTYF